METSAMPNRIRFTGAEQADLEPFDLPQLKPDQIHVRAHYSLMSTGTEGIAYARLFDEGTHWDNWVKYPFYPGYAMIGEVVAVGGQVTDRQVGQIVAVRAPHASDIVLEPQYTVRVPAGADLEQATWFASAKIASFAARAARHNLGQSVTVVGAGPIGQMAVRWAAAAGVTTLVMVDPMAARLEMASAGGATVTVNRPVQEAKQPVWEACPDSAGPDVVIEVTGHPMVFAGALALPRDFGRLILLGDTGQPGEQRLTGDVVKRGISITGVHDSHNTARWNDAVATRVFFDLVTAGRFPLDGLITHRFKPNDAAEAYALAKTHRDQTMGILFDWT